MVNTQLISDEFNVDMTMLLQTTKNNMIEHSCKDTIY